MCAQNRTRTCTSLLTLVPETSASTIPPPGQRAENETRTRDPNLGKVVLYQLSYFRRAFCRKTGRLLSNAVQKYNLFPKLQTFRRFFRIFVPFLKALLKGGFTFLGVLISQRCTFWGGGGSMAECVTDVTYKRARHPNENHQNACSFFGLLLIPYSLPLVPCSLFLVPPYSSLFLLIPPYFSFFLLLSPSFSFFLLLPSSSFFLLPPFCKTSL